MKKTMVMLDSISAVKDFVSIVSAYDYDVDLASGRYAVDAKSIMGIFSLDLSKPIQLTAHTDDAGKFLNSYYDAKIYEQDPFARLDQHGVGKLVETAAKLGRQTRPNIKLGICGEHGGDPSSIEFCDKVGLTYVSCSPFRVPIARLAAAQANLANKK